jgi:hypothetical protein
MAHVIPHGEAGPRCKERPQENFDANTFENLILLCPTCHTKIDKDPDSFPRNMLLEWKENHLSNLAQSHGIKAYPYRSEVRSRIVGLMDENRAIWTKFAPEDGVEFEYNPESEVGKAWDHRVRSVILPNHYRIQAIVQANLELATDAERQIFAEYREHVRGLAERHICGVARCAIRFPEAMNGMFL